MNWAQENKTLAGIVGVMAAGGLGLGVWLYLSWSGYSTAMDDWNSAQDSIARIRGAKLEPTDANVAKREKELSDYSNQVNQLRNALLSVQRDPTPVSENEFLAKLKERSAAMKTLATTLGMKPLPDDFALGFERYASQSPRTAQVASQLALHMEAVEKVVTTCIEAGISELNLLERTKLEDEDAPLPPKVETSPKTKKTKTPAGKKKTKTVITEEAAAEPVLDRYPIKLIITTDQRPFETIVNTLCHPGKTAPHFLVLRQLRIENAKQEGPTKEEARSRLDAAQKGAAAGGAATTEPTTTTEPPKPGDGQVITPPKPAPVDAIDILGGEMLKVYMEVDYIRFRPAAKVEEEGASEAPAKAAAPAKS